jgi:hypothetical protein
MFHFNADVLNYRVALAALAEHVHHQTYVVVAISTARS